MAVFLLVQNPVPEVHTLVFRRGNQGHCQSIGSINWVSEVPPRHGCRIIGIVFIPAGGYSRDNAIKIESGKVVVNSEMPFYGTYNGRSPDEFLRELRTLIEAK